MVMKNSGAAFYHLLTTSHFQMGIVFTILESFWSDLIFLVRAEGSLCD